MGGFVAEILYGASIWLLPALIAITFHEAAHGFVAWRLGDPTAKMLGRVTFNPFRHIDPMGTVVLPALLAIMKAPFLFGWAKPVPVDFRKLRNPRQGMVLVAAAGPGINLVLAVMSALGFYLVPLVPGWLSHWLERNLFNSMHLNIVLMVFNMIPIPPLDGGRVAVGLLPRSLGRPLARMEQYGMLVLILGLFVIPFMASEFGYNLQIFQALIEPVVVATWRAILVLVGLR